MHTAATCGQVGSPGSGRRALAARLRTLPGVSAPSSVVRSTMEIAVSMAHALAVVLMDLVLSTAVRASAPTWSTPGRPCRKARKAASEWVTSPYGGSGVLVSGVSADSAPGSSTWVMRSFSPAAVATTARITRAEQVVCTSVQEWSAVSRRAATAACAVRGSPAASAIARGVAADSVFRPLRQAVDRDARRARCFVKGPTESGNSLLSWGFVLRRALLRTRLRTSVRVLRRGRERADVRPGRARRRRPAPPSRGGVARPRRGAGPGAEPDRRRTGPHRAPGGAGPGTGARRAQDHGLLAARARPALPGRGRAAGPQRPRAGAAARDGRGVRRRGGHHRAGERRRPGDPSGALGGRRRPGRGGGRGRRRAGRDRRHPAARPAGPGGGPLSGPAGPRRTRARPHRGPVADAGPPQRRHRRAARPARRRGWGEGGRRAGVLRAGRP